MVGIIGVLNNLVSGMIIASLLIVTSVFRAMDMVCEKKADSKHDFSKDPIKWVVNGNDLYADGIILGADDGIWSSLLLSLTG